MRSVPVVLFGMVVLAGCGSVATSPTAAPGGSASATASATATPKPAAVDATFGQDNCTAPGLTGKPVVAYGDNGPGTGRFSMAVADGWSSQPDVGIHGTAWGEHGDVSAGFAMLTVSYPTSPPADALTALHVNYDIFAKDPPNSGTPGPITSCTIGGEKAYFFSEVNNPGQPPIYYFAVAHNGNAYTFSAIPDASSGTKEADWIPAVKLMLGSWVWV